MERLINIMVAIGYVVVALFLVSLLSMSTKVWNITLAIDVLLCIVELVISGLIIKMSKEEGA